MNEACKLCRGACCESIKLPLPADPDVAQWLGLHGRVSSATVALECKCRALVDGKCSIYQDRPQVCRDYAPGSPACRETVVLRRRGEMFRIIALLDSEARDAAAE